MADSSEQWAKVRAAGLSVVVSEPKGAEVAIGWVSADAVEGVLEAYAFLIRELDEQAAPRIRAGE